MADIGSIEIIGTIITANVTALAAAVAIMKKSNGNRQPPIHKSEVTPEQISQIMHFIENTEKVLTEAGRIQHTQVRYMDDLRQELSALRVEVSELKGRMR